MRKYISRIAENENLKIDEKAITALIYVSDGDLRKLTNIMQSIALDSTKITESSIYDISARARPKEIASMFNYAIKGLFEQARMELSKLMINQGLSGEDILIQCYKETQSLPIDDRIKLGIIVAIGESNFRIVEGANERIQLEAMLAQIALNASKKH